MSDKPVYDPLLETVRSKNIRGFKFEEVEFTKCNSVYPECDGVDVYHCAWCRCNSDELFLDVGYTPRGVPVFTTLLGHNGPLRYGPVFDWVVHITDPDSDYEVVKTGSATTFESAVGRMLKTAKVEVARALKKFRSRSLSYAQKHLSEWVIEDYQGRKP